MNICLIKIIMIRDIEIDLTKYEVGLKKLYPHLTDEEIKELIFEMFKVLKKWYELEIKD